MPSSWASVAHGSRRRYAAHPQLLDEFKSSTADCIKIVKSAKRYAQDWGAEGIDEYYRMGVITAAVARVRAAWETLVATASSGSGCAAASSGCAASGAIGDGKGTRGDGSAAALPLANVASVARAALTDAVAVFGTIHDKCKYEAPSLAASSASFGRMTAPTESCVPPPLRRGGA